MMKNITVKSGFQLRKKTIDNCLNKNITFHIDILIFIAIIKLAKRRKKYGKKIRNNKRKMSSKS